MENKETCASKIYMHREGQQERGRKRSKGTSWREQGGKHGDRKGTRTEAGVGCLKHAIVRIIPKGPCHIYIYIYLVYNRLSMISHQSLYEYRYNHSSNKVTRHTICSSTPNPLLAAEKTPRATPGGC